jgi:ADP-heptose:LPS heptosyltransferase
LRSGAHLIAVCPGAGHPKRRWPVEDYAAAVRAAATTRPVGVVLLGGPQDAPSAERFLRVLPSDVPVVNAVGRTSLRTTLAVLRRSALYLGGDTGTMHLACSAGTPCVVVSCHPRTGSPASANAPQRFGPWGVRSVFLQPSEPIDPCSAQCLSSVAHCIRAVTVDQVTAALSTLLTDERSESLA